MACRVWRDRLVQPAISRIERPQPRHQPVVASMEHTFTQGLSIASCMVQLLIEQPSAHKMQFESFSAEAIIAAAELPLRLTKEYQHAHLVYPC